MNRLVLILPVFILFAASCIKRHKGDDEVFKWDKNKKLDILIAGLPEPLSQQNADQVVAARWGFRYKRVAGCMVTQRLNDSIDQHNKKVFEALTEKFGKDWDKREQKEQDAELLTEKKVIVLLNQLKQNKQKQAELYKQGNGLDYWMEESNIKLQYIVNADGWDKIKGEDEWVRYYKYMVDLNNNSVKMISDTITKL